MINLYWPSALAAAEYDASEQTAAFADQESIDDWRATYSAFCD